MIPNKLGLPGEQYVLPSSWVFPRTLPGKLPGDSWVSYYEVRPWGQGGAGQTIHLRPDEVVHWGTPGPIHPYDGYSPLAAGGPWVDVSDSIDRSRAARFGNSITPDWALILSDEYQDPTPAEMEALRNKLQGYMGEERTGLPFLVPPGMELSEVGRGPNEMDYTASSEQARDMIGALYRVGKSIVGITEEVNRATAIAARENFRHMAVRPFLSQLDAVLSEKLAKRFDPSLVVYHQEVGEFDPEEGLKEVAAGVRTPNEYRAEIGLPPYEHGGDDPLIPSGQVVLPLNTGEETLPDLDTLLMPDDRVAQKQQEQQAKEEADRQGQEAQAQRDHELKQQAADTQEATAKVLRMLAKRLRAPVAVLTNGDGREPVQKAAPDDSGPSEPEDEAGDDETLTDANSGQYAEMIAEILYGLYGDEALDHITGEATKAWSAMDHPRGPNGQFIPKGSAEAQAAAREAVGKVLKGEGGDPKTVAEHLAILTVKQLKDLHKEHGKAIPGKLRADLVAAVQSKLPVEQPKEPEKPQGKENASLADWLKAEPEGSDLVAHTIKHLPSLDPIKGKLAIKDMGQAARTHLYHLSLMPEPVLEKLADSGLRGVYIGDGALPAHDQLERYRGVRPRGWPEGSTWDTVAGAYDNDGKQIIAGTGEYGSESLALHETGHAIGDLLSLNDSPELIDHHKRLWINLDPYLRQGGPGAHPGRQELLAESVAVYLMRGRDYAVGQYSEAYVSWLEKAALA